jgi:uncharacterized protein YcbX
MMPDHLLRVLAETEAEQSGTSETILGIAATTVASQIAAVDEAPKGVHATIEAAVATSHQGDAEVQVSSPRRPELLHTLSISTQWTAAPSVAEAARVVRAKVEMTRLRDEVLVHGILNSTTGDSVSLLEEGKE